VLCHPALEWASSWDGLRWGKRKNHPFLCRNTRFYDIPIV